MRVLVMLLLFLGASGYAAPPPPPPNGWPADVPAASQPQTIAPLPPAGSPLCGHLENITCSLVLLPLGSFFLPGLGQYWDGRTGWPYTLAAVGGLTLTAATLGDPEEPVNLLDPNDQAALFASQMWLGAAFLSAYDTYRYRVQDELGVPTELSSVPDVLLASFDFRALGHLKVAVPWAAIGALAISSVFAEQDGQVSQPFEAFRWHDGLFSLGLSVGAGAGEEPFFRGFMMHGLHHVAGWNRWLANGTQSLVFAAAHADFSYGFLVRTGFGFYAGWLAQSENYNLRDAIFLHTWWDIFSLVGSLASERRLEPAWITFPAIRF